MDPDIHFGEIENEPPQSHLRPDRNRHFTVASVYQPRDRDLPIFVDLDVMRDMEEHARSDTRVELGGVLLGSQCSDDEGRPFVVVTDSLRAQHYESTKGSFKFTHDTWEQITREREAFSSELQMVGWYHTHPDWGVFLSTMDLFICENFFNRLLDVALVIDPCRRDRGFFQWTGGEQAQTRRTGGFYLTTSRFRTSELQLYAAQLEGKMTVAHDQRYSLQTPSYPAPVVLSTPASTWQTVAVFGMLSLQFCFLMLIAWRLLPPIGDGSNRPDVAAIKDSVDRLAAVRQRETEVDAKLEVLEMIVRQGTNAPQGVLKSLADEKALTEELRGSLRGQQSLSRELNGKVTDLESSLAEAKRRDERQQAEVAGLETKLAELTSRLEESRAELGANKQRKELAEAAEGRSWWSIAMDNSKTVGLGAILGALTIGAVLAVAQRLKKPGSDNQRGDESGNASQETNN